MRIILWIADLIALVLCLLWYIKEPGYEPMVTGIAPVVGLIVLLFTKSKKTAKTVMKQKSGKGSTQYQSGGDMNVNH